MFTFSTTDHHDERWLAEQADRALEVVLRSGTDSSSIDVELDLWRSFVAAHHAGVGLLHAAVAVALRHGAGRPTGQLRSDLRAALDSPVPVFAPAPVPC